MTDILLISNTTENIELALRHFYSRDYNASATVSYDAAMETLSEPKNKSVAVFYCGDTTDNFISFYRRLRENEITADRPLIVLTDVKWAKPLTEYVKLKNTCVLGIGVGSSKLSEAVRNAARGGNNKRPTQPLRPSQPHKPSQSQRPFSQRSSMNNQRHY